MSYKFIFWFKSNTLSLRFLNQFLVVQARFCIESKNIGTSVPGPSGGNQVDGLPPDVHTGAGKIDCTRVQRLSMHFAKKYVNIRHTLNHLLIFGSVEVEETIFKFVFT